MNNIKTWIVGEVKAAQFLKSLGYKIIDQNSKIAGSEIDIVAILPKSVRKKEILKEFKNRNFTNKQEKKIYKTALKAEINELRDTLVFVEVKARSSKKFGEPFEAVGEQKQHNIERGVLAYSKKYNRKNLPIRIDVVSIVDDEIEHIPNAFESKY